MEEKYLLRGNKNIYNTWRARDVLGFFVMRVVRVRVTLNLKYYFKITNEKKFKFKNVKLILQILRSKGLYMTT